MLRIDSREVRMEAGDQLSGYCSNLSEPRAAAEEMMRGPDSG